MTLRGVCLKDINNSHFHFITCAYATTYPSYLLRAKHLGKYAHYHFLGSLNVFNQ